MAGTGATWLLWQSPVRALARATGYEMTPWGAISTPNMTICRVWRSCRFWPLEMSKPSPWLEPPIFSRLRKSLTLREAKSDKLCEAEPRNLEPGSFRPVRRKASKELSAAKRWAVVPVTPPQVLALRRHRLWCLAARSAGRSSPMHVEKTCRIGGRFPAFGNHLHNLPLLRGHLRRPARCRRPDPCSHGLAPRRRSRESLRGLNSQATPRRTE